MNDSKPDPLDTLFAQARARRFNTSAMEYGFETRLMARLHEQREPGSIWAMVSWRMMPFFAACMLALTVWRSEVITESEDAAQAASTDNPAALDSCGQLEL